MSRVVFFHRDFSGMFPVEAQVILDRYSHHMIGGPNQATLHVKPTADGWELMKLLRCPVEIYGADGGCKWWGYVDRVTIPHGIERVGLGLDELFNSVSIKHSSGTTSAATDAQSVAEFGTKQFFLNMSRVTQAEAEQYRDTYIETHKFPVPEIELSGGAEEIVIECYGWWKTLDWKHYSNTSTTFVDNATQVSTIITSAGQFIAGVVVKDLAGDTSNPQRDGANTALAYIEELLKAGTSNSRPLLAYVDRNRYVHIYERPAVNAEYVMRDDGRIETLFGRLVEDENCLNAVWARVKSVPDVMGGLGVMRPFFIEHAEYIEEDEGDSDER